jgi:queuosine precursor transporter
MTRSTTAAVAAYIASITAANLLVAEYGPSVTIINAFALIGLDLALRDYLHDAWRARFAPMAGLIAAAGLVSFALNPATGRIAMASCVAFTLAAAADWLVYTLAERKPWLVRSNASNVAGAAVDSMLFPTLAFGVVLWPIVLGQFVAKTLGGAAWSLLIAVARPEPAVVAAHDNRS